MNDDAGLEKEADVMGAKALSYPEKSFQLKSMNSTTENVHQLKKDLGRKKGVAVDEIHKKRQLKGAREGMSEEEEIQQKELDEAVKKFPKLKKILCDDC